MRVPLSLLFTVVFAVISSALARSASEPTSYLDFGEWKPRESLKPFWAGVQKDWWLNGPSEELLAYCKRYAEKSTPEVLIPEMIEDLRAEYSLVRHSCYVQVSLHWPPERALAVLRPYYRGTDQTARDLAVDFIADIEELQQQQVPEADAPKKG
jgi:hypothetical protein